MDRETILVGYDGSLGARAALRWALAEAMRQKVRVRLVWVVEWPVRGRPGHSGTGHLARRSGLP